MLPASFQTPAAIVLLAGGLISCFAGYRVFRMPPVGGKVTILPAMLPKKKSDASVGHAS